MISIVSVQTSPVISMHFTCGRDEIFRYSGVFMWNAAPVHRRLKRVTKGIWLSGFRLDCLIHTWSFNLLGEWGHSYCLQVDTKSKGGGHAVNCMGNLQIAKADRLEHIKHISRAKTFWPKVRLHHAVLDAAESIPNWRLKEDLDLTYPSCCTRQCCREVRPAKCRLVWSSSATTQAQLTMWSHVYHNRTSSQWSNLYMYREIVSKYCNKTVHIRSRSDELVFHIIILLL